MSAGWSDAENLDKKSKDEAPLSPAPPAHFFVTGKRRAAWCGNGGVAALKALPPRVYVDQETIIRPVSVVDLRRGDHCMITLNVLRALSPRVDYLVSLIGMYELFHHFHHFVMLDDVASLDEHGVPRTEDGEIATIMEYANTMPAAWHQIVQSCNGQWWRLPVQSVNLLLEKCHCQVVPLADYGDMPHIFRVEETLNAESRDRIVRDAMEMLKTNPKYNIFWANCEHTTNLVTKRGEFTSPLIRYTLWTLLRLSMNLIGLVILHSLLMNCYSSYCIMYPVWSLCAYYVFTALPVGLQVLIQFVRLAGTVRKSYLRSEISQVDQWHLLVKEACRVIVVGTSAVGLLAQVPSLVRSTGYVWCISFSVVWVYMLSDMLFSLLCHLSVDLLMHTFGRFWLVGGSPLSLKDEELPRSVCRREDVSAPGLLQEVNGSREQWQADARQAACADNSSTARRGKAGPRKRSRKQ